MLLQAFFFFFNIISALSSQASASCSSSQAGLSIMSATCHSAVQHWGITSAGQFRKAGLKYECYSLVSPFAASPIPAHIFLWNTCLFVLTFSSAIYLLLLHHVFSLFFSSESCNCLVNIFVHLLQHLCIEEKKKNHRHYACRL